MLRPFKLQGGLREQAWTAILSMDLVRLLLDDIEGFNEISQIDEIRWRKSHLTINACRRFGKSCPNRDRYVYGPSAMTLQSPFPHEVKEFNRRRNSWHYRRLSPCCTNRHPVWIRRIRNFIGTGITYPNLLSTVPQTSVQMNMAVRH